MSTPQSSVRLGIIGAGGIARRHAGVLQGMEDVRIVAVADTDVARAEAFATELGAGAYRSSEEMLQREALDAVYICVPPFAHGAPEDAVIGAGLPFFVEKPLSVDLATAEATAAKVERSGLITATGYHLRYLDTVEEARNLLADNPARLVSGYWLDQTPPPRWWWQQSASGGQIVEQATHIIDLARYTVGEIVEVFAQSVQVSRADFPGLDVAAATSVTVRFANGAVGTFTATCLLRWSHRIGLHLFADGLAIELSDRDIMVDVGHGRPVRQAGQDPVYLEDRDFIDAVLGATNRIRCPYGEALKTHRVALAIARSAETGMPVRLHHQIAEPADA
ncbi:MAG TPA: Gfo/Idh/MocA family oxidoreductase [Xanthobacteraceae bacterium]|nr:Gfo/Idh/MocA family oxidoreductase [Xanthobacteraceae bacterium]